MGDLHAPLLGSVVLSSATSWMTLHLLLGDEPLFHVPPYALVHPVELIFYALLGLIGGLISVLFVKMILWMRPRFAAMPERTRWIQPAAGGLLVGVLAWFVPQVLGVGYTYVGDALNGHMAFQLMALMHRQCWRDFWTEPLHWRNDRRSRGNSRACGAASVHGESRGLRSGRHGRRVRGNCPRSTHLSDNDFRNDT